MTHGDRPPESATPRPAERGAPRETLWPHAPTHQLSASGTYFVTVGTYRKVHHFRGRDRLNYAHQNPVKRGLVPVAKLYPWCSAAWFERTAAPAQVKTIYAFPTDRVNVHDDYDVPRDGL